MLAPFNPAWEDHLALEALKHLVFVLGEDFLAVDVVHFDVEWPVLPREDLVAALVGTPVVVLPDHVPLFVQQLWVLPDGEPDWGQEPVAALIVVRPLEAIVGIL